MGYQCTSLYRPVGPLHKTRVKHVLRLIAKAVVFTMTDGSEMLFTWSDDIDALERTHGPTRIEVRLHDDLVLSDGRSSFVLDASDDDDITSMDKGIHVRGYRDLSIGTAVNHCGFGIVLGEVGETTTQSDKVQFDVLMAYRAFVDKWIRHGRLEETFTYDEEAGPRPYKIVVSGADLVMAENCCS